MPLFFVLIYNIMLEYIYNNSTKMWTRAIRSGEKENKQTNESEYRYRTINYTNVYEYELTNYIILHFIQLPTANEHRWGRRKKINKNKNIDL